MLWSHYPFCKHSHISHSTCSTQTQNKQGSLQPEVQLSLFYQHSSPQSCQALTCFNHKSTFPCLWSPWPHFSYPPHFQPESFLLPTHLHPTVKSPSLLQSYLQLSANPCSTQSPHALPTSNSTTEKLLECSQCHPGDGNQGSLAAARLAQVLQKHRMKAEGCAAHLPRRAGFHALEAVRGLAAAHLQQFTCPSGVLGAKATGLRPT